MSFRVVQLVNNLDLGGLERVVLILASHLRERNVLSEIVCVEDAGALAPEATRLGIPVTALQAERRGSWRALRDLIRYLKPRGPVVLHSHNFKPFWYAARARVWGAARGHVHTRHGAFLRPHRFLWRYRLLRPWTTAICTVSSEGREQLARWSGLPPGAIHVVPNGVDMEVYRPAADKVALRKRLGCDETRPVVITVARLAPEKDLATLMQAVAKVPDVEWWLVGYGPEERPLRALADELGLGARVRFWGSRSDVADLLAAADVFALSSLSEGLSMALIEAAACGLPIVATDVGGNQEIVNPPHGGRLVRPRDPNALANAMRELVENPSLRAELGRNARQHAVSHFSVEAMVDRYQQLYARTGQVGR